MSAGKAGRALMLLILVHVFCYPGRVAADWRVSADGPSASELSETMARAELGSVSAATDSFEAKLGLGVDTGVTVNDDNFEFKLLGTGMTLGRTMEISIFGSSLKFNLW
ncbi:hypothetical protein HF521_020968 [Silurus meridionalis]|uniref:Uncharacterized protein n=1 Tax=Silurus meridionalis TaxID=175797 RepID=A0A8T0BEQ9_SILME|nr:hypothetical protein HF521_020968 [Silurus meridionalis]